MTEEEKSNYKVIVPTFNGVKEDWSIYKIKMESYLTQKDCVELLSWTDPIPKDDAVWADTNDADVKKKNDAEKQIRMQNRKAAGIVLSSIMTDTDKGKAAFVKCSYLGMHALGLCTMPMILLR